MSDLLARQRGCPVFGRHRRKAKPELPARQRPREILTVEQMRAVALRVALADARRALERVRERVDPQHARRLVAIQLELLALEGRSP